jgi:DNA-binding NtrC family response regulator
MPLFRKVTCKRRTMPHRTMVNIATFILDDDKEVLGLIKDVIDLAGIRDYKLFTDEQDFIDGLTDEIHVCIVDHILNSKTGLDILHEIKRRNQHSFVIIYSGIKNPNTIIDYLNSDADKFVDKNKPDHLAQLGQYALMGLDVARNRIEFMNYLKATAEKHDNELDYNRGTD